MTFQQAIRPSGSLAEGKKYYGRNHKLYGYKVEVSVLPIGLVVHCTDHYPGSMADLDIFYRNADFHEIALAKREADTSDNITDSGPLKLQYPDTCAILMDKCYQGATDRVRAIHLKRETRNDVLTRSEVDTNKQISSDEIIVENWFGRDCKLWGLCSNKWKWSEDLFDPFFKICSAFTNFHATLHPLQADDLQFYR